eukprot:GEMP01023034.1.p1 GENE.GEMP01023034.1~~GEMP01023034.1.p1  ORF type:complete len:329 (+),score=46.66 GEMP01023034.1:360-1346(+)
MISSHATTFSITRAKTTFTRPGATEVSFSFAFSEDSCVGWEPNCNYLHTLWRGSRLMFHGNCTAHMCMGHLPIDTLVDPHNPPVICDSYQADRGVRNAPSEYNQDWFLYYNFFRTEEMRRRRREDPSRIGSSDFHYVDIGASLPVEYSNTVFFDRCLNWTGICVEPSPYLQPLLELYRTCTVIQHCAHDIYRPGHSFHHPDGSPAFHADCFPLDDILTRAGYRNQTIDILSLDIEKQERMVMSQFPLQDYDIRFVVMEVTRGPGWLEMDTRFFLNGFAKIAVLGRDLVYAKLSTREMFHAKFRWARWLGSGAIARRQLLHTVDGGRGL